ncbi:aspartoacylase [Vibrio sp. WJH972]
MKVDNLNSVLIVSGTHGNELSGIYLNKLINDGLYDAKRPSFDTVLIIANKEAMKRNVRFIETDLNREFSNLNEGDSTRERHPIARQIIEEYSQTDNQLIVDLHNTTSNMGATLILLSSDAFYLKMGAYIKQYMPEANILFEDTITWSEQAYLCTAGQHGVMIEVGAQAHGALKHETLDLMKRMLTLVLDYVEKHNTQQIPKLNDFNAFYFTEEVHIPLDTNGMRQAIVHPSICGKDFEPVKSGEPLLVTFTGKEICWKGKGEIYPHFINEAAYSLANIAMALAEKRTVSVD